MVEGQKKDLYNHAKILDEWNQDITSEYIEQGLTNQNSKLFVSYFLDLSKKKTAGYVNRNRSKIKSIFIGLQRQGITDISKANILDIENYFYEWIKNHSPDYIQRWNAFCSWYQKENRKQGNIITDLRIDLKDFRKKKNESSFVWLSKEDFDNLRTYFDEDKQTILLFCFDSLIRAPTELSSVKVFLLFLFTFFNLFFRFFHLFKKTFIKYYVPEEYLPYVDFSLCGIHLIALEWCNHWKGCYGIKRLVHKFESKEQQNDSN